MGVKQWVFQRLSNVAIIVFGFWLVYFLASPGAITAETINDLFSNTASLIYLTITLVLAGLNSILAGWQIAGDYAEKFNLNQTFLVSFGTIVSVAYIAVGFCILF
ncbi:MAG TPA: succinate dehydrogenase, hydrophobic membrane anchor protein [Cellvibrionales bacterium]|jgi:succinate dehydrogenase / fumarate reductase membrane anchor subunit|nr:succinate dehydrogenase, hydrophobic membrane anchor protein [Cellvibrionales bacterium]HCX26652.1 succinate dehydrogenase, hydrophobic membrane anchor protein [Cellvibrionales bacterium]